MVGDAEGGSALLVGGDADSGGVGAACAFLCLPRSSIVFGNASFDAGKGDCPMLWGISECPADGRLGGKFWVLIE